MALIFLKHVFSATRLDWLLFSIGLDLALCDLLVHGSISRREAKKLGLSCFIRVAFTVHKGSWRNG